MTVDLTDVTTDPIAAIYLAKGEPFTINVTLDRLRGFGFSPVNLNAANNPFLLTLSYLSKSNSHAFELSPLADYYHNHQPKNAAEVLGLESNSKLADYPPLAAILPWYNNTPERHEQFMREGIANYWKAKNIPLNADDGITEYGPVCDLKGEQEIMRLLEVQHSIQTHGYSRDYGDIMASLLVGADGLWACHVRDGIHRIAVLAIIGVSSVAVCITGGDILAVIRRNEVDSWPQVQNGLFTSEEALQVFDTMLEGR